MARKKTTSQPIPFSDKGFDRKTGKPDETPQWHLQAVTLRYQMDDDRAPKLTAKGEGYLARRIIELAEEHDVPIYKDHNLVQVLSKLNLNDEIPPDVYEVVARILAFVYRVSQNDSA